MVRIIVIFMLFVCSLSAQTTLADLRTRPNIVVILGGDDIGSFTIEQGTKLKHVDSTTWYSYSMDWMRNIQPSISLSFPNFFTTPICTNTRISVLTGRTANQSFHQFSWLHPYEETIFNKLQFAGYYTGGFGKWQLSQNLFITTEKFNIDNTDVFQQTKDFGFHEFIFHNILDRNFRFSNCQDYYDQDGIAVCGANQYGPDLIKNSVKNFIDNRKSSNQPFAVYWSQLLPHNPWEPSPIHPDYPTPINSGNLGEIKYLPSNLEYLDSITKEVINSMVNEPEFYKGAGTIIFHFSDNGIDQRVEVANTTDTITGGKGLSNPRGTKVGLKVIYLTNRGKAFTNGDVDNTPINLTDIFATIKDLAGINQISSRSGISFANKIKNNMPVVADRNCLCQYYNRYFDPVSITTTFCTDGIYWLNENGFYNAISDPTLTTPIIPVTGAEVTAFNKLTLERLLFPDADKLNKNIYNVRN